MRGVIYINGINELSIIDSTFTQNDAGPVFTNRQDVGLNHRQTVSYLTQPTLQLQRASAIFIEGQIQKIRISGGDL